MSLTDPTGLVEETDGVFITDEAHAVGIRLSCVNAAVEFMSRRGIGDEGEMMALAQRMWAFAKDGK